MIDEKIITNFYLLDNVKENKPFDWLDSSFETSKNLFSGTDILFSSEIEKEVIDFSKEKKCNFFYTLVSPNNFVVYSFVDCGDLIEMTIPYFYNKEIDFDSFISIFQKNKKNQETKFLHKENKNDLDELELLNEIKRVDN